MKRSILFGTLGLALLAAVVSVTAANPQGKWRSSLNGYREVPSVSTTGHGLFTATLDGDGIDFELRYADLEGSPTAAHIHFGQQHTNAGVIAFLCGGGGQDACPPSPGMVSGRIEAGNVMGPQDKGIDPGEFEALVQAMVAGATYVNVHTDLHPTGEIRGQIGRGLSAGAVRRGR